MKHIKQVSIKILQKSIKWCQKSISSNDMMLIIIKFKREMVPESLQYNRSLKESKQSQPDSDSPLYFGNYKVIMNDYHKGDPLLTLGPNYIIFLSAFFIVNIASILVLLKLQSSEETHTFYLIGLLVGIYLDIVWLATALINPGIAVSDSQFDGDYCKECRNNNKIFILKQPGRVHCKQCEVCIDDQAHHLKLAGGCIGKNNFIIFKMLLLGIFLWGISMITIVPIIQHI